MVKQGTDKEGVLTISNQFGICGLEMIIRHILIPDQILVDQWVARSSLGVLICLNGWWRWLKCLIRAQWQIHFTIFGILQPIISQSVFFSVSSMIHRATLSLSVCLPGGGEG